MSEWIEKRLGEIVEIIDPHPSHRAPAIVDGGIPFLGIGDLNERGQIINPSARKVDESVFKDHQARYKIDNETIGFGRVATIGKIIKLGEHLEKVAVSPTMAIIQPIKVDSHFLFYLLSAESTKEEIDKFLTGSTRSSLGIELLRTLKINLPADPAEQARIARILSTVDEAIEQTEALIAKYNRIRTGLMQDLLTRGIDEQGRIRSEATHAFKDSPLGRVPVEWEVTNLKQALNCIEAGKSPNCPDIPAGMNQWGVLKVSAVGAKGFVESENKVILEEKFVNQRYQVKSEDLLMTRANTAELVGLVCIVGDLSSQLLLSDKTLRLVVNEERADKRFIMTVLKSPAVRRQIEIEATGSSASMKNISQSNIFNLTVALPDVMEQKRISDKIQKVDAALSAKREHLHKLQTLKKGLMQDLLAGPKGHDEVS